MITPFLRTPYNYDMNAAGDESGLVCDELTRTQQQFKEECDINTIVERFGLTGQLPAPGTMQLPLEGDFAEVTDFQSAMNQILAAQAGFMMLPALVRERFANDPHQFVAFCSDPANLEEARKMGLARPQEPPPSPISVQVVAPAPVPAPGS